MTAVATPTDQAAEYLQKMTLESQSKVTESTKKSVDSSSVASGTKSARSFTPKLPDSLYTSPYYLPNSQYYYGDWQGQPYVIPEGLEVNQGAYGDNGLYMYHPGMYAPYSPYLPPLSPGPTGEHNTQAYGAQYYQYPTSYIQTPYPSQYSSGKGENASAAAPAPAHQVPPSTNFKYNGIANNSGSKGNNGNQTHNYPSYNGNGYGAGSMPGGILPAASYQDPRFVGYNGLQWQTLENQYFGHGYQRPVTSSPLKPSVVNKTIVPSKNQNFRPHSMNSYQPRPMFGMNTSGGYTNGAYSDKLYGRGWTEVYTNLKPNVRMNGFSSYRTDGLNELNRGPRAEPIRNQKGIHSSLAVKEQTIPVTDKISDENASPDIEQYNLATFPETYSDAKFFIIKSYSEDDVHKSIKYNVWSSTLAGNKKLDAAYLDAQQKSEICPVFLFFSVNTSGQFVGVAEMVGPVDFDKSFEYWQQDKWLGCFPVKWHIVKDTPNILLKHIINESNESKPVTNSRDTQEVDLPQGLEMLKVFKNHNSKQCILDDFYFYEDRQKIIQEKKAKHRQYLKQAQLARTSKPSDESTETKNDDNKEATSNSTLENITTPNEIVALENKDATNEVGC